MDTIDVEFKNILGGTYRYAIPYSSTTKTYTAKVFRTATPTVIIASSSDPLKTKAFAKVVGLILQKGIEALEQSLKPKEMSDEFNQNEFQ